MNRLAPRDLVRSGLCIGCGGCVAGASPDQARMRLDAFGLLRPEGTPEWYRGRTDSLSHTCPFSPDAMDEDELASRLFPAAPLRHPATGRFVASYVGHALEPGFREQGSSGGMTSWTAAELLRRDLVDAVIHVAAADPAADGRHFRYRVSREVDELRAGAKSRYYPVELSGVLRAVAAEPGRYALVGIPCFVKAVQLLRHADPLFRKRIRYCLGLFCGHMKSARFVESIAWQMGVALEDVAHLEFRRKLPGRPASWYNASLTLRDGRTVDKDWWHLADGDWGAGFFMDSACNACDDVAAEVADASFGDAWVEPYASDWRGTNIVVVRSPAIAALIERGIGDGRLQLEQVDAELVAATQAAGLRQRREGLAYRLARRSGRSGVSPRKRVAADARKAGFGRRRIYRMRVRISAWSHRVFWLARRLGAPRLYLYWARVTAVVYHPVAYGKGSWGNLLRRLGLD